MMLTTDIFSGKNQKTEQKTQMNSYIPGMNIMY